jgi:release factor glutamine methyltransferase
MSQPDADVSPQLAEVAARLRSAGSVFAEEEAGLMLAEATTPPHLDELIVKRMSGLPLEQILGWAEFCGLRIAVEPGVFVPRQRTGFMVEIAVELATAGDVALDLCCGTGAVGAALKAAVPDIQVYAADVDPAAVACARRNLPASDVFEGDLFDSLPESLAGRVSLLLANAPYVPTDAISLMPPEARLHEARVALDGGDDGLSVQRRITAGASQWLAPGGRLLIETSERQAPHTSALFAAAGLSATVRHSDDFDSTIVIGVLPSQ